MKKLNNKIYVLLLLTLFGGFSACDVLDVDPADQLPGDKAFQSVSDIENGILGAYSELQSLSYYGRTYLIFSDLAADNLTHPTDATASDYAEVDNNVMLSTNSTIEDMWNAIYAAINTANTVISKVPNMSDMTESEKSAALGELYFLRALNHFNLMNYFGAIPIKTSPTIGTSNLDIARSSVSDVYKQIVSDLTYAEAHLDANNSTKVRATRYAATALLARVYLYEEKYDSAYEKANEVITKGGYSLLSNYGSIFTDGSAETIFEVEFDATDRNRIAEFNYPKTLNGRGEVRPDASLIAAYEKKDVRDSVSIAYKGTTPYAKKYTDLSLGDQNVIVLRLAEMYLIRAEAEAHLSNGVIKDVQDDVNAIRNRVGLGDTDADTMSKLILAIEQERRVEFAFEGHRWFDLKRTGRAMKVLPNVTKSNQLLFPIPLTEITYNSKMTQNPGY